MQNYNYQQMPPAHYAPYQPYPPYSPYPPAPQFTPEQLERRELRKTSNGLGFFVLAFFLIIHRGKPNLPYLCASNHCKHCFRHDSRVVLPHSFAKTPEQPPYQESCEALAPHPHAICGNGSRYAG